MLWGQNAIVGSGFSNGWGGGSCPTGNANFSYMTAGAGNSFIAIKNASGIGNQHFRFGIDWSGTTAQRTISIGSDVSIVPSTTYALNNNCSTNGSIVLNVPSTSYQYVFKTMDAGFNPTGTFVVFEIQGSVRSITGVNQSPAANAVKPGNTVTITANLDGTLNSGQQVYLRYTTNNFLTSVVVPMIGSGSVFSASIPAGTNTAGANVQYYVFTSGPNNVSADGSNADLYTINLNNNGGSNYSYTVLTPSIVYQHNFGTTSITAHPYVVAPNLFAQNLSNSSWASSTNAWTSFAGNTGQALSLSNSSGNPTYTLTFDIASGYALDITSFDFWRERSATGAQNWSLTINGINAGAGNVPTSGAFTGVTNVASPATAITGTVTVALTLSGATGSGTFRLDDFTLNGYVYPIAGPVTAIQSPIGTTINNGGNRANFGNIIVGQSSDFIFRISNRGGSNPLAVGNISFGGANSTDLSLVNPPILPLSIAAGSSQDITVRIAPAATGTRIASITFSSNDATGNSTYTVSLSANGIPSTASDIIDNTNYSGSSPEFNSNPSYINFTDGSATTTGKIIAMKFRIRDGGAGLNDADNLGTSLDGIAFNVSNTSGISRGNFIKQAIITTSAGTVIASATSITGSQIVFTGLSNANFTVADNTQTASNLHLRIAFNEASVIDNEKLVFSVASATASPGGSQFGTANAGGAQTDNSTSNDRNRIEVLATALAFVQQPSSTGFGQTMVPSPTVEAIDANGRRDLDFTGSVSLTSTGTMTGSPITIAASAGLVTYASVVHTVQQPARTLSASCTGLTMALSGSFDINASSGTTDFFRTAAGFTSGNWSSASSWESSPDNMTWVPATIAPNSSASSINVRSGTLTIDAAASAKLLMIQAGAVLVHNIGVSFVIADDGSAAPDLIINGRYELNGDQPTFNANASAIVSSAAEVRVNSNSGGFSDNFARNTAISWLDAAVFNWNAGGIASFEASGEIYFPNTPDNVVPVFRVSANLGSIGGSGTTIINGRFECNGSITFQGATAIVLRNGIAGTGTITQSSTCGPFRITGSNSQLGTTGSSTLTLALRNDVNSGLSIQSGTCTLMGNVSVNSGPFYIQAGVNFIASVRSLIGTASFTLSNNATLSTAHVNGVNGSIQLTGTKMFAAGANYTFNGSADQSTGSLMGTNIGTLTINNPGSVTLSQTGHTTTTLNLNAGFFKCGTNQNINIAAGGIINGNGGQQPNDPSSGNITFLGSGQTTGTAAGSPKLYSVILKGPVQFRGGTTPHSATILNMLRLDVTNAINTDAPYYSPNSTLVYNSGGTYARSFEWGQPIPGAQGYPYNVLVQNSTIVNLAANTPTSLEIGGSLIIGTSTSGSNIVDMNAATIPLRILGNLVIGDPSTSLNRLTMSTANGGNLELYGNFTRYKFNNYYDNEAYNGGRGRSTIFKGTGSSVVDIIDANDAANEVQKFHKMVMDKTGSGDVTLLVPNLFIESELELINGILHTTQGTPPGAPAAPPGLNYGLITLESNAVVTGSTTAGCFVNGQIAKQFGTNTATEFIFPVGKLGAPIPNRPFWFTKTNNATGTMRGEYFYYEPPHKGFDNFASSLMGIVNTEYWQFDKTAGDISGKIILDYRNPGAGNWRGPSGFTGVDPCSNCNVAVVKRSTDFNTGIWDFTSLTGVFASTPANLPEYRWYLNNGRISSSVVSTFSPFTIGFSYNVVLGNAALFSRLLSFEGLLRNGHAELSWRIDNNASLREFVLQHSTDAVQFESIGKMNASGLYYNYTHTNRPAGKHFYRLHIIESNGRSYYSHVVELLVLQASTSINGLQSSVVRNHLNISISSETNQTARAIIYDRAGKLIAQQQQQLQAGSNQFHIPVALLTAGIYYVEIITADGLRKTLRWLKE